MRYLLAFVCCTVLACSREDADPADPLDGRYQISGDVIVCDGAADEIGEPEFGPFTEYRCEWENTVPGCTWAAVMFTRDDAAEQWQVLETACCNPLSDTTWQCG
jgi:hypothetical protein